MPQILTAATNPVRAGSEKTLGWQNSLKNAVRSGAELTKLLNLPPTMLPSEAATKQFPVFATREFISRMKPGDPHDPLLQQVFPLADEEQSGDGFTADPLGERSVTHGGGLIHKYPGRVLLVTTGACAIHCRYCFRRHFPYSQLPHSIDQWAPGLDHIAEDPSIEEVLLSGGDPLMLTDPLLQRLIEAIQSIDHVRRLRIHSRLPIVLPSRITTDLVDLLKQTRLNTWMVIHTNHANEIDADVEQAISKMVDVGIPVLNQSVLLRGVNDNASALINLSKRLIDMRVIPYYLHQLDRVIGASHFEVPIADGQQLIQAMRSQLPGYAVPQYVIEQPGEASKTVIAPVG